MPGGLLQPPALPQLGRLAGGVGRHEVQGGPVPPLHEHVPAAPGRQAQDESRPLHLADRGRLWISGFLFLFPLSPFRRGIWTKFLMTEAFYYYYYEEL